MTVARLVQALQWYRAVPLTRCSTAVRVAWQPQFPCHLDISSTTDQNTPSKNDIMSEMDAEVADDILARVALDGSMD